MPIRLVSFDTDDTLYDFTTLSTSAIEKMLELVRGTVGAGADGISVAEIISDFDTTADDMDHPYARIPELRRRSFTRTLARYGCRNDDLVREMERTYVRHRFAPVTLFHGVRDVLETLAYEYTLCIISNGEQNFAELGVADLFSFTLTATDIGIQKPDPRIYQKAMSRAGCSPAEMAHVGDSVRSDVAGAKAAGAWAIWFNPESRENPYEIQPDRQIQTLMELPDALKSLT
jgi:putative hydrolase of the HAD superfamily